MTTGNAPYKISYSRRRSIGILVTPDDGVIVRAPYRTPLYLIERFVKAKSVWIEKHIESYSGMVRLSHSEVYAGKALLFLGKEYRLKVTGSARNSVSQGENEIIVCAKNSQDMKAISRILDSWYKKWAVRHISSKLEEILTSHRDYGFNPSGVSIRSMKRRWGSCSSKGKIILNSELIKLNDEYIEYVILHELCHLQHHNHSQAFYKLLSQVFPGWKETRRKLKNYIT